MRLPLGRITSVALRAVLYAESKEIIACKSSIYMTHPIQNGYRIKHTGSETENEAAAVVAVFSCHSGHWGRGISDMRCRRRNGPQLRRRSGAPAAANGTVVPQRSDARYAQAAALDAQGRV